MVPAAVTNHIIPIYFPERPPISRGKIQFHSSVRPLFSSIHGIYKTNTNAQNEGDLFFPQISLRTQRRNFSILSCLPPSSQPSPPPTPGTRFNPSTRLFVSGLSFRTTEESLRNAFKNFGELVELNLVMDKIANRPRGFAFLRYATEEESKKAIEGMHGKFLDGRVIFVEVAKSRSELRRGLKEDAKQ